MAVLMTRSVTVAPIVPVSVVSSGLIAVAA
jgi:hypothetical protein